MRTAAKLPARQKQVVIEVLAHIERHGRLPTNRELASVLNLKSQGSVNDFLRGLERRGIVIRRPDVRTPPTKYQNTTSRVNIPLARQPVENIDFHLSPAQISRADLAVIR